MNNRTIAFGILTVSLLLAGVLLTSGGIFMRSVGINCTNCNLLIITVDTLRADHVLPYGYFQATTPEMDLLAKDGVVFSRAFSQIPHTPPSHWSMFTGLYPFKHQKYTMNDNGTGMRTLMGVLGEAGYTTGGIVSSKILRGFSREFEYFNGMTGKNRSVRFIRRPGNETAVSALEWLGDHSSERFFLWVHLFDPHSPYDPPEGFGVFDYTEAEEYSDGRYDQNGLTRVGEIRKDIERYDGEILFADEMIGKIIEKTRDLGLYEKTLIILLADHGECFGEHNFSDFGYDDNRPCLFHGKTLYEEEVHVPFIMRIPGNGVRNVIVDDIVETVDLFPTVLEILGFEDFNGTDGESLTGLLKGNERKKDYALFQTRPVKRGLLSLGIRTDKWKFIDMVPNDIDIERERSEQEEGIFDESAEIDASMEIKKMLFRVDEGEMWNFHSTEPEISKGMEELLGKIVKEELDFEFEDADNETEALLRSLGYI